MKTDHIKREQPHLDNLFEEAAERIEQALDYINLMILGMVDADQEKMNLFIDKLLELGKNFDNRADLIVERLFSREVMTFARSDRLNLIHKMENVIEHLLDNTRRAHSYSPVIIPPELAGCLKTIAQNCKIVGTHIKKAVLFLFSDFNAAEQQIMKIREFQRETRNLLWATLHEIFLKVENPRDLLYFDRLLRDLRLSYDKINELGMEIRSLIIKYRI